MEKDSGHALAELAVDGGMSNSDLTMQVRERTTSCLFPLLPFPLKNVLAVVGDDDNRHKQT